MLSVSSRTIRIGHDARNIVEKRRAEDAFRSNSCETESKGRLVGQVPSQIDVLTQELNSSQLLMKLWFSTYSRYGFARDASDKSMAIGVCMRQPCQ